MCHFHTTAPVQCSLTAVSITVASCTPKGKTATYYHHNAPQHCTTASAPLRRTTSGLLQLQANDCSTVPLLLPRGSHITTATRCCQLLNSTHSSIDADGGSAPLPATKRRLAVAQAIRSSSTWAVALCMPLFEQ